MWIEFVCCFWILSVMADEPFSFPKDGASKRSPMVWRMAVLGFVMVCGVYILSVCLKQIGIGTVSTFGNLQVFNQSCPDLDVSPAERHLIHYPKPMTYDRAECRCNPVRYFAILSMQRSGSGWFETLLNSHINISSNGEIFSNKVRRSNITSIEDTLDTIYNLDWFSSASKNECTAAVGLKWMLNQGVMHNHEEVVDYFKRRGVSAIFLFRRNLLRRMISLLANSYDQDVKLINGTHKSHVHSHHEAAILAKYKPTINVKQLIPQLKEVEDMSKKALGYFKDTRHTVVYYEDILKNHTKLVEVQEFLRVPVRELKSRQVKIHKGSLSEHVENWEEVQKTLRGTPYETLLTDDY